MSINLLEVHDLKKKYKEMEAVKGVSFTVQKGEIFALIGPNGAGKTTTLRVISTLLQPTSGRVIVDGLDVTKDAMKVREKIAYLPEEAGAYKNMTGQDYLQFMASLFFDDAHKRKSRVAYAMELSGLRDRLDDKIGSYSKGMTRKLLIARSVMTEPALAVLDEPTSGLDILNALEVRKTIKELAKNGVSFLVSSHNMLEIEFISDRVGIMDKGVLHVTGTPEQLKKSYDACNLEEAFAKVVTGV
jgi:ABC-2 type transport system ATP-binding protein